MRHPVLALAVLALAALPPASRPATAQSAAETGAAIVGAAVAAAFSPAERRVIEDYFRAARQQEGRKHGKKDGLPPGLAKKDQLPPGLAKRDTLPPGLEKRALPGDLESRLPRLSKNRQRVMVGDDVLLIEAATGVILDIIRGVGR